MRIYVNYYTGENGEYKQSKRVFKSYKSLYNNLGTFKNIMDIKVCDNDREFVVTGHYNIRSYIKFFTK